jgi:hypothetical protein
MKVNCSPIWRAGPGRTRAIPAEGIRVRELQRRVKETTMMSRSRFYVFWDSLKDSHEIHREGNLIFRAERKGG